MSEVAYEPLYLEGIKHFNECDFFEAHEVWEELWTDYRGESRKFYQGLIQAAVALHHFGNGNIRGARKLYHSSSDYLERIGRKHLGLDLDKFLAEFNAASREVIGQHRGVSGHRDRSGADPGDSPRSTVAGAARAIDARHMTRAATNHGVSSDEPSFAAEKFSGIARLFPLPNLVVFPHVMQPLHIFEPRYRALLEESLDGDSLIAMAILAPGWEANYEGRPPLGRRLLVQSRHPSPDRRRQLQCAVVGRQADRDCARTAASQAVSRGRSAALPRRLSAGFGRRATLVAAEKVAELFKQSLPQLAESTEGARPVLGKHVPLGMLTDIIAYTLDLRNLDTKGSNFLPRQMSIGAWSCFFEYLLHSRPRDEARHFRRRSATIEEFTAFAMLWP